MTCRIDFKLSRTNHLLTTCSNDHVEVAVPVASRKRAVDLLGTGSGSESIRWELIFQHLWNRTGSSLAESRRKRVADSDPSRGSSADLRYLLITET